MIDQLPLDLFDTGNGIDSTAVEDQEQELLTFCQWCGVLVEPAEAICPNCGSVPFRCAIGDSVPVAALNAFQDSAIDCQWCDAAIPAGEDRCPSCSADLPDPTLRIPGVNVPLSDEEIREMMSSADAS